MGIEIDIDRIKEEMEYSMEEVFESWKETLGHGSYPSGTSMSAWSTTSMTAGEFHIVPYAPEFIEMSVVLDYDENIESKVEVEVKPEPVTPAKPVKRYSKKTFKKKLKELCG